MNKINECRFTYALFFGIDLTEGIEIKREKFTITLFYKIYKDFLGKF